MGMAIENVELINKCSFKHLCMGSVIMNNTKKQMKKASRKEWKGKKVIGNEKTMFFYPHYAWGYPVKNYRRGADDL